jgi:hypothetical protein
MEAVWNEGENFRTEGKKLDNFPHFGILGEYRQFRARKARGSVAAARQFPAYGRDRTMEGASRTIEQKPGALPPRHTTPRGVSGGPVVGGPGCGPPF